MGKTRDTGNLVDNNSGTNTGDQDLSAKAPYTKYASVTGSSVTTTSATAVDATGLILAVAANKTYKITGVLVTGCDNTGGVRLTMTGPAGSAVVKGIWAGSSTSSSGSQNLQVLSLGTLSTTAVGFNRFATSGGVVSLICYITTSSTAGNIQLQFASQTAGQTSTIFIGSTIDITEVQL